MNENVEIYREFVDHQVASHEARLEEQSECADAIDLILLRLFAENTFFSIKPKSTSECVSWEQDGF